MSISAPLVCFATHFSNRLANKVYLKVADLAALEKMYGKAIERYEGVARTSANNNLMKWSLKDYFLKAGFCHLAQNVCSTPSEEFTPCQELPITNTLR